MSAFESTIFLPFILLLVLISEKENSLVIRKWAGLLGLTLILHLLLRYAVAGSLLGAYGQDFFSSGLKMYLLNMAKVGGRLLLPPAKNAILLTGIFILLIVAVGILILKNLRKIRQEQILRNILFLSGMLFISCMIPVLSGVSTQTSETDRALYFPSVFLSMIIGELIVYLIKKFRNQCILMAVILSYNLIFLEKNNLNWKKASSVTQMIMEKINEKNRLGNNGRIFFLNIPNEIEGAYVFRQGFQDALKLNGFDRDKYFAVNYLSRQDLEKMKEKIFVQPGNIETALAPDILIKQDPAGCRQIYDHGHLKFTSRPGDQIYYWNVDNLEPVQACVVFSPG
jgi:protein O-mannosyl-transferase